MSWLRTILKIVGGALATGGYLTSSKWTVISGVIASLVGAGMSQWEHESDTGPFTRLLVFLGKSLPPPPAASLLFICGLGLLAASQSGCASTPTGVSTAQIITSDTQSAALHLLAAEPTWRNDMSQADQGLRDAIVAQAFTSGGIMDFVGKYVSPTSKAYAVINDVIAKSAPDLVAVEAGIAAALKATAPPTAPPAAPSTSAATS